LTQYVKHDKTGKLCQLQSFHCTSSFSLTAWAQFVFEMPQQCLLNLPFCSHCSASWACRFHHATIAALLDLCIIWFTGRLTLRQRKSTQTTRSFLDQKGVENNDTRRSFQTLNKKLTVALQVVISPFLNAAAWLIWMPL
jgi:hypothetical protein